jgi:hypothetical protein
VSTAVHQYYNWTVLRHDATRQLAAASFFLFFEVSEQSSDETSLIMIDIRNSSTS